MVLIFGKTTGKEDNELQDVDGSFLATNVYLWLV
jgi:hypothetical protein